jgi:hypothetical protein
MDAEEERRREQIREDERRWETIREENQLALEVEHKQRRNHEESKAYHKGLATGDYTEWYLVIGRSPQESRQVTGSCPGSGSGFYEVYVQPVRNALSDAHRVPWEWRSRWLSNLGLIKPERPQNALVTVQGIIRQVTDRRDALRPRRQGMDLDLTQYTATIEYDAEIRVILDQLQQLKAYLASTAS